MSNYTQIELFLIISIDCHYSYSILSINLIKIIELNNLTEENVLNFEVNNIYTEVLVYFKLVFSKTINDTKNILD